MGLRHCTASLQGAVGSGDHTASMQGAVGSARTISPCLRCSRCAEGNCTLDMALGASGGKRFGPECHFAHHPICLMLQTLQRLSRVRAHIPPPPKFRIRRWGGSTPLSECGGERRQGCGATGGGRAVRKAAGEGLQNGYKQLKCCWSTRERLVEGSKTRPMRHDAIRGEAEHPMRCRTARGTPIENRSHTTLESSGGTAICRVRNAA